MATVFDNAMAAHVWAQQNQESGRSHNGNLFFEGRAIFSYGRHYCAGYIMPAELARPGFRFNGNSAPLGLYNADSYPISTGRHVSYVRRAIRGAPHAVPGLTELAREFERAAYQIQPRPDVSPEAMRGRLAEARDMARKAIESHCAAPENWPGLATVAALFGAAGADNPERRAAALERRKDSAAKAEAAKRAKEKASRADSEARAWAARSVAEVLAEMRAEARGPYFRADPAARQWAERGRALHRLARHAKAKGWTRMAADLRAIYKAIRAEIPGFDLAEARRARVSVWQRNKRKLRDGLARLATLEMRPDADSAPIHAGRMAALNLAEALRAEGDGNRGAWAARPARAAGLCPEELAASLDGKAERLGKVAEVLAEAKRRADARARLAEVRAALADLAAGLDSVAPEMLPAIAKRAEAARRHVWGFARHAPLYKGDSCKPLYAMPGAWAVAGWTPDKAGRLHRILAAHAEAAKRAEAEAKRAIEAAQRAEAIQTWRETGRATFAGPNGPQPWRGRLADAQGGALLRVADVARDESGAVTGGRLITSQGAEVPLTHAIRAFRFLKLCRERGTAWRANGKTLAVGHFRVDSVDAQGNFVAGCHRINWPEVETVARAVGVLDLAPADTAEARETV